jgi:hypothetical protein
MHIVGAHLGAHLELDDLDFVGNDGRLCAFVEGRVEHLDGVGMELVGEAGPLERKRHVARAVFVLRRSASKETYGEEEGILWGKAL